MEELPPLFDNMTDKEASMMTNDSATLVAKINNLRAKQLHGGGLTNEDVREGVKLLNELRTIRAGKASTPESRIPLEKLF